MIYLPSEALLKKIINCCAHGKDGKTIFGIDDMMEQFVDAAKIKEKKKKKAPKKPKTKNISDLLKYEKENSDYIVIEKFADYFKECDGNVDWNLMGSFLPIDRKNKE